MYRTIERFVLASASPRRRALLQGIGLDFEVFSADIDESVRSGEDPCDYARRMAREKAEASMHRFPDQWIVAADTVVFREGRLFGKPDSEDGAIQTLLGLRNAVHQVATAFFLGSLQRKIQYQESVLTHVRFGDFTEDTARAYVATGEPLDKAGAYGIQGIGGVFVDEVQGSYTNVVGLPLCQVVGAMSKYGIVKTK